MSVTVQEHVDILHVDADADVTESTATRLESESDRLAVETATSATACLERITDRPPDCIISGDDVSGMDSLELLRAVREEYPDIPFILFTDEGSEAVAREALSAGVTDYLEKQSATDQYPRLVNRIQNAVERYQAENRLDEIREEYAAVFENAQNGLLLVDVVDDGFRYQRCNSRAVELIGRDESQIVGHTPKEALGPENGTKVIEAYRKCIEQREPVEYGLTLDLPVGEVIRECQVSPVSSNGDIETLTVAFRDTTERHNREEELEAEQQFVQQSLDTLEDVFYVLDTDGRLKQWNEQVEEMTGYSESDLAEMPALEFFPEDEHDTIEDTIERILSTGKATVEADVFTAAGERIPHEFHGKRLTDTDGTTTGIVGIGRDLTERRKRRTKLEQTETLFEHAQDPLFFIDVGQEYTIERVNPAYEESTGLSAERVHGQPPTDVFGTQNGSTIEAKFDQCVETQEPLAYHEQVEIEGRLTTWETSIAPVVVDGTVEYIAGSTRDITERKQRKQQIETLKNQYQTVVENYPDGAVFLYDTDHQVVRAGGAELSAVGVSPAELEGTTPRDRYSPDIAEKLVEHIEAAFDGESNTFRQTYEGKHYQIQMVPVRTDEGQITHCLAVSRNVTEQREREKELQRKTRAIEKAPVGITITDPAQSDNPMVYLNEMFSRITGYAPDEALGRNCRFIQGDETSPAAVETLRTGIQNQEPVSTELVNYRKDGTKFWNRVNIAPVYDDAGELVNFVGFQQDVTERKEREQALQKRERILRELHTATREFYPPKSETAVAEFLVEFVANTFSFEYASVKLYDGESGSLQPAARSVTSPKPTEVGEISPGTNPVWEAYRQGTTQIVGDETVADSIDGVDSSVTRVVAVPIGDFGVVLAYTTDDSQFDDVDMDLIEIVTTTAESSFQRLQSDSVRTELVEELSLQQTKAEELRTLVSTIQEIQRRLANSETREALETSVCEELLETDPVDFAWIGRPVGQDTHLDPSTWAGEGTAYLDAVEPSTETSLVPAQRAADTRDSYSHAAIRSLVVDEPWAKDALSFGFNSVLSVPLVYDDVVYGVLTAYSHDEDAFDDMYEYLLSDVASLVVNYGRILEQRYDEESQAYAELEFELTDTAYPLQHIATETQSTIRFNAVVENRTDELRILVTVVDGDVDQVLSAARLSNSVVDAEQFGGPTQSQLTLTVQKPFLASIVGKHNAKLAQATSDAASTGFQVLLPRGMSNRPLLDALSSRYREIELVAHRQTEISSQLELDDVADVLTDRQYEILTAAYHGGYYDTPRQVTGEDLAENFDISGSAIHKHLQSAHRTLLDQFF